jgi:Ca2+-binding EF-hand superfamily protein
MTQAVIKAFQVSEEELRGYRGLFEDFDTDGNKKLNRAEMVAFLEAAELEAQLVDLAFAVFDKDKSGFLDFEEFVESVLFATMGKDELPRYTRRIFEAFDVDKSGKLDSKELRTFLKVLQVDRLDEWHDYIFKETRGQPVSVEDIIDIFQRPRT